MKIITVRPRNTDDRWDATQRKIERLYGKRCGFKPDHGFVTDTTAYGQIVKAVGPRQWNVIERARIDILTKGA